MSSTRGPVSSEPKESVVVAQLCARRHYAVAVALEQAGALRHFYTDLWTGNGIVGRAVRALAPWFSSKGLKKWAGRREPRLPNEKVTAFTRLGLEYGRRLRKCRSRSEQTQTYLWVGEKFGRLVAKHGFKGGSVVYGVLGGARVIFEAAKQSGLQTVLDQMSCPRVWRRLEKEEMERWHGWELSANGTEDRYAEAANEWENAELRMADVVLCPSPFVQEYVISLGILEEKTRVVPYGIPAQRFVCRRETYRGDRPLRLLFVGRVSLMKGVPYLLEALRLLNSKKVEARLVGPVGIPEKVLSPYRRYCEITGPVPRSEVMQHYAWADVFVFPSLCEGSALVTYEALAAGLTVICTPNSGSVVQDAQEGFIAAIRDPGALAARIEAFLDSSQLVAAMSERAVQRASEFSLEQYSRRLASVIQELTNG